MLPNEIRTEHFNAYPPMAKQLLAGEIDLLRRLPLGFAPLLLREVIEYDWRFPVERRALDREIAFLKSLPAERFARLMEGFTQLQISRDLEKIDWVNEPASFSEKLTAQLWGTHQIDSFRASAIAYGQSRSAALPDEPPPHDRLIIVVIGKEVERNTYPLFRKLRPHGVYYRKVNPGAGVRGLMQAVAKRAESKPLLFGHWYIDGEIAEPVSSTSIATVSYSALAPVRGTIQRKMKSAYESRIGAEAIRTMLVRLRPDEVGMPAGGSDTVLSRFQTTLLTEGSGTQWFSTTFVQWAAREALRRAQPVTLLARFTPRFRERPTDELLAPSTSQLELDPPGSLVDADMGAYYTWLNQQRLSGADRSSFLAWFEGHQEALAIAPSFRRGVESDTPIELAELVGRLL
jgi:hypothetical protein